MVSYTTLSGGWSGYYRRIYFKQQRVIGYSGKIYFRMKYKIKFYRGSPLSDTERKRLNLEAGRLIQSLGISIAVTENNFDVLREKHGFVGYANYYLRQCYDESQLVNKADVTIYGQLLEIDTKLGTTQAEQLLWCVHWSVRMDLIKV